MEDVIAKPDVESELACGFDKVFSKYMEIYWCNSSYRYDDIDLFAKLGLHCYNFEKGTNFKFMCCEKFSMHSTEYLDYYITFEAMNPANNLAFTFQTMFSYSGYLNDTTYIYRIHAARRRSNKRVDENWDADKVIDEFYTRETPYWLSDEALASDKKKYYVVKESELHENDWLHLYLELARSSKFEESQGRDSQQWEINKVVIETKEDYIRDASEKLKAENAIFYISYKYKGASESSLDGDHKAIVRKTMDGKPEHMSLEVSNV